MSGLSSWVCPACETHNTAHESHLAARCSKCGATVKLNQSDWDVKRGRVYIGACPTPILRLKGSPGGPAHLFIKGGRVGRMTCGVSVRLPVISGPGDRPCANCQRATHNIFTAKETGHETN